MSPADTLRRYVAERASSVDRGDGDPRSLVSFVAESGALRQSDGDVKATADLIELVAGECMSSAFSLWAHCMVVEYLSGSVGSLGDVHADLLAGDRLGSTAMAPALQESAGLGTVGVRAEPDGRFLRLNGKISWASNLVSDAVVVLPARIGDTDRRVVAAVPLGSDGVTVSPPRHLLALNATASSSIRLDDVLVGPENIVTNDLPVFLQRARPVLLVLQTAFCLGLAGRCLSEAAAAASGPSTSVLGPDIDYASERVRELKSIARVVQRDPVRSHPDTVTRLRFDAGQLTLRAAHLELAAAGGRGYAGHSSTSRRVREAMFLPVQSPSEVQLRWELNRGTPAVAASDGLRPSPRTLV